MTLTTTRTIKCKCGKEFNMDVYTTVNVTVDPELKEKVLKGEINTRVCPRCGRKYQIVPSLFLYSDMDRLFWIEVYPEEERERAEEIKRQMLEEKSPAPEPKSIFRYNVKDLVFGFDELRKLVKKAEKKYGPDEGKKFGRITTRKMKKFEREEYGIKKGHLFDLPNEEVKKRLKESFEKDARDINKRLRLARTEKSKEKWRKLKKKIKKIRVAHKDFFEKMISLF